MEPTRIEDLDDEQRRAFHGITNVVPYQDPEQFRAAAALVRESMDALTAYMRAYAQAALPAMKAFTRAFQELREAGVIDDDGKPARRADRPAWQSPYGPPPRRR